MKIGVPKEIKTHEYRVGLTPQSTAELVRQGHEVVIEHAAGDGSGFDDSEYSEAGAEIGASARSVFESCDLIVKVKEPQLSECSFLSPGQCLFTYLHLAADIEQADALRKSGCTAIAYETVTDSQGGLPLLRPMSEVAGRLSVQEAATALQKWRGGRGVLIGGVPGVAPAKVTILGGGVAGTNAALIAMGMRADVSVFDKSPERLAQLDTLFGDRLRTCFATQSAIDAAVQNSDVVIGAVLVPGASAPKLISRGVLGNMKSGSVIVDISIDQGGCFETSKPTTHEQPTYLVDGVVHYCVTNMPGSVARTSTYALNNVTLSHILNISANGWQDALKHDEHLANGLNVWNGHITHPAVAGSLNAPSISVGDALD